MASESTLASASTASHQIDVLFAHVPQVWLVPVVLVAALALGWWSWRRYGPIPGSRVSGTIARSARAVAVGLLVLLAAGPALRTTTVTVTPGSLVVGVDASASMAVPDYQPTTGLAGDQPRLTAASALADALAEKIDPAQAAVHYETMCTSPGTSTSTELLPSTMHGWRDPAAATAFASGTSSPLADDLLRLISRTKPEALVLVTDGRLTDGGSFAELATALRERSIRVNILAPGTDQITPDLAIDEVVINREAALNEREPVVVRLSHRGLASNAPIHLRFSVDQGQTIEMDTPTGSGTGTASAVMASAEARNDVIFPHQGNAKLTVTASAGTLSTSQTVTVSVRERRLTVLLLDRQPRYEMRYVREAFKRDRTVTLHAYLADGRWKRWGNDGPDRLPLSPSDLAGYDVVVLGDLGPDAFRASDLAALESAVRVGGTGLVWMPGESGASAAFSSEKLGELLPIELSDTAALARGYLSAGRILDRTDIAKRLGLLEPGETPWTALPRLLGAAPVVNVRPGSEILAQDQDAQPLVVTRAYGNGRSLFIGVDDTWRWRRNVGDLYLHRFHSQLLRYAGANHRGERKAWRLAATPRRVSPGETVLLSLAPLSSAAGERPSSVVVRLIPGASTSNATQREILVPLSADAEGFAARIPAPSTGTWELALAAGPEVSSVEDSDLLVLPAGSERRDTRADRAALDAFAAACGGTVDTTASALVQRLSTDLRRQQTHTAVVGLWDTIWALLLIVTLFGLDWGIRRANRMP